MSDQDLLKDFCFCIDRETIKNFKDASVEEKLEWLEEVSEFIETFVPLEKRKIWQHFLENE